MQSSCQGLVIRSYKVFYEKDAQRGAESFGMQICPSEMCKRPVMRRLAGSVMIGAFFIREEAPPHAESPSP